MHDVEARFADSGVIRAIITTMHAWRKDSSRSRVLAPGPRKVADMTTLQTYPLPRDFPKIRSSSLRPMLIPTPTILQAVQGGGVC
jgi:hypothetical protein